MRKLVLSTLVATSLMASGVFATGVSADAEPNANGRNCNGVGISSGAPELNPVERADLFFGGSVQDLQKAHPQGNTCP